MATWPPTRPATKGTATTVSSRRRPDRRGRRERVLDALPVHRVVGRAGGVRELHVASTRTAGSSRSRRSPRRRRWRTACAPRDRARGWADHRDLPGIGAVAPRRDRPPRTGWSSSSTTPPSPPPPLAGPPAGHAAGVRPPRRGRRPVPPRRPPDLTATVDLGAVPRGRGDRPGTRRRDHAAELLAMAGDDLAGRWLHRPGATLETRCSSDRRSPASWTRAASAGSACSSSPRAASRNDVPGPRARAPPASSLTAPAAATTLPSMLSTSQHRGCDGPPACKRRPGTRGRGRPDCRTWPRRHRGCPVTPIVKAPEGLSHGVPQRSPRVTPARMPLPCRPVRRAVHAATQHRSRTT